MNGHLELKGGTPAAALNKARRHFAQVAQHLPKQLFGHLGWPFPVGIGKPVATGRRRAAHFDQRWNGST
jgi:hypothetical protein